MEGKILKELQVIKKELQDIRSILEPNVLTEFTINEMRTKFGLQSLDEEIANKNLIAIK